MAIFCKKRIIDSTKQYIIKYIIKLLVDLGYLAKRYLIFYNEHVIIHQLLYNIIMTNFLSNIMLNSSMTKILILILILL
jgi:hypothetical protein